MPSEKKRKRELSSEANGPPPDYTITVAPASDFPPILGLPHLIPSIRELTERETNSFITWHIYATNYSIHTLRPRTQPTLQEVPESRGIPALWGDS